MVDWLGAGNWSVLDWDVFVLTSWGFWFIVDINWLVVSLVSVASSVVLGDVLGKKLEDFVGPTLGSLEGESLVRVLGRSEGNLLG